MQQSENDKRNEKPAKLCQFKFWNDVNTLLTADGPITKGPVPRCQRKKEAAQASNNSSLNSSRPRSFSTPALNNLLKTPTKSTDPETNRMAKTPGKNPKTPTADRFIPSRSASNFELAHLKLNRPDDYCGESPSKAALEHIMGENLYGTDITKQRVLAFQRKAPSAPDGFQNPNRVVYTQRKTPTSAKHSNRYIPQMPDRILDAPDIIDDYYLNLLDWGSNNILAAALGNCVYLWDAATGKIEQLLELEGSDYVCSLAWIQEGECLAVGTTTGVTELWDASRGRRLRILDGHSARVGALAWNSYVVTSGCRSGQIIHHDVRQRHHMIGSISGHQQEVCGLKWSTNGKYLASGGNDNVLNIWPVSANGLNTQTQALHTFTAHQAAVKALAWCPWQPHLLASGGGTADRHIRFWNCNTGVCVKSIDTKSQVCSLVWSSNYKEIVSAHGFVHNELIIWKYPGMTKVAELTGHTARVLQLVMSPDGESVLSAGADETLRLWKCFTRVSTKVPENSTSKLKVSAFKQSIR